MWKSIPTVIDIPKPFLIPENPQSITKGKTVVGESPATLHNLDQSGRPVHHSPHANPSFYLPER